MKKALFVVTVLLINNLVFAQNGQIIHIDWEPDLTQTFHNWIQIGDPVFLDVDQNGFCEWRFKAYDGDHQSIYLRLEPNAHPLADTLGLYTYQRLQQSQFGDTLSNLDFFRSVYTWKDLGQFTHQMIGLRYMVDEGYCYGWIDVSIELKDPAPTVGASRIDIIVHEMAYCTIPNYPLCVGQKDFNWDVEETEATAFATLHPNPTQGVFTVTGKDLKQAEVLNTLGQRVAAAAGQGETLHIDLANLPEGIYFVRITDEKGRKCVRKVVKE